MSDFRLLVLRSAYLTLTMNAIPQETKHRKVSLSEGALMFSDEIFQSWINP